MGIKVGINGFGRIGRNIMRAAMQNSDANIEFVAVNDITNPETLAHLLKYDSVLGNLSDPVNVDGDGLRVGDSHFKVLSERDPGALPWAELGVDIVLESTGLFTKRDDASKHLAAGASKVIITAPAKGPDVMLVLGVNDEKYNATEHHIISNASCTTNCLAPVAYVLNKAIGIERGYMTTIHAFTGDQRTTDTLHSDPRRARAASQSLIPTSTGAAKAVGLVLPELNGKLDGTSIRVPTPNVSLIDFKFDAVRDTDVAEINGAIQKAAAGSLKGILDTNDEPLVSIDFNHNPASSIFDLTQTQVLEGKFVRVLSWYDNEWGFSNRMSDTAIAMAALG